MEFYLSSKLYVDMQGESSKNQYVFFFFFSFKKFEIVHKEDTISDNFLQNEIQLEIPWTG